MNCIIIIDVLSKRVRLSINKKISLENLARIACNLLKVDFNKFKIMSSSGVWLNKHYLINNCHHNRVIYLNLVPRLRGGVADFLSDIQGGQAAANLRHVEDGVAARDMRAAREAARAAAPPSAPKTVPKTVPKNKAGLMAAGVGAAALLGHSFLKDKATSGKKEGVEAVLIKNKEKLEAKEKENTKKMQTGGIAVIAGLSCSMAALGGIMLMFASKK